MTAQVNFSRPSGTYENSWQPPFSNSITQSLNMPPYQQTVYQPTYVQQPVQIPNDGRSTIISTGGNAGQPVYTTNYRTINEPFNRPVDNSSVVVGPQQTIVRQPGLVEEVQRPDYTKIYQSNLPNKRLGPDTDPAIKSSCCTPWWWLLAAILGLIALTLALLFGLGNFGGNKSASETQIGAITPSINSNGNSSPSNLNGGNTGPAITPAGTTSVSDFTSTGKDVFGTYPSTTTTYAPSDVYSQPQTSVTPATVAPVSVQPVAYNPVPSSSTSGSSNLSVASPSTAAPAASTQ